jgi:hypothetical protein
MKIIVISALLTISLYANFTISSGEILELSSDENITILEDLNISKDATLKADKNATLHLGNDWINGGDFIGESSTVVFVGNDTSVVYGDNSFFNLYADKSITFQSSKTQKIKNELILRDGKIRSSTFGSYAMLDLSLTKSIYTNNLDVQDSKIIGLEKAINPTNSVDSGNNILWFSLSTTCQNIDSDINWIDRFSCEQTNLKYIVDGGDVRSEVSFDADISSDIVETPYISDGSSERQIDSTSIIYKDIQSSINGCSKDLKVKLYKDGTSQTGFESDKSEGCSYEDPTLSNWDDFKDSTEIFISKTSKLEKEAHENSNSVIVVDVNLTKQLIIGGSYDEK